MRFHNREHAAHLLAKQLTVYRGRHQGVLGIPRGAVPMAKIIADALEGDLDVVLVHKLGAPGNPELAVGAVDETGHLYLNEVVDNGIATGASMIAALRAVRAKRPAKLIAAVAVAPAETVARM
ncbi:MAG: phosphoribosyltransferase family protein, partial [Thermodesulfobacteriota bacterium]